jgi:predicted nicotinamide N-methyase
MAGHGTGGGLDPAAFIRANTHVRPVAGVPEIRIHTAHAASGLWRLAGTEDRSSPYWAYAWAGGLALARHFLEEPGKVAGRRLLDLGCGSGLVGIAAARAGAAVVMAADTDANAITALKLNAALNGMEITAIHGDMTGEPPPAVDLVAVGDLFYERGLGRRVSAFLDRCLAAGIAVLVGDPYRAFLPRHRLRLVAEYKTEDFGTAGSDIPAGVFAWRAAEREQVDE